MKRNIQNTHHLIGKSLDREYNVEMDENKIKMNMYRHNALHSLFGVLLTPQEQLKELRCLYDSILSDSSKQLFDELLNNKDFYIPGLKRGSLKKKIKNS